MENHQQSAKRMIVANNPGAALTEAVRILQSGGVIIFPTETVYGIGVAAGNQAALDKLRSLKNRDAAKPFQLLVANVQMAEALGAVFSHEAQRLAQRFWPGPMTLITPSHNGDENMGIRIPDHALVRDLCLMSEQAIVASSANLAGSEPPHNADAADVFGNAVDLILDGGLISEGIPSTVVQVYDDRYEILRAGSITASAIEATWNDLSIEGDTQCWRTRKSSSARITLRRK